MKTTDKRPRAQDELLGFLSGYWVTQMIFVAAKLGIADAIARTPQTADAIAKRVGAHAPSLHRLLRGLASVGVFAEDAKGRFRLTPMAATLRSDVPGSLRHFAMMMSDNYNWSAWGELLHGIRSGELVFDRTHGVPIFEYLRTHPEEDRIFSASMASISGPENDAIAKAYPFGKLGTLVDVGGAHGHLLATIVRRHRRLRGVLFDQPQVVEAAAQSGFITSRDVNARITVTGGSFFDNVPAGADAYIMKYIIHDWNDDQCETILRNCRAAMATNGRVLVVEHVISKGNKADWGKLLDINMFVVTGGKERTREEFKALFARAGLKLQKIHPTAAAVSILEAVRA